ncbi:MAG TPA: nucleotide exchange factor GrpE [Actinomycetota bacterium]|nr:nucleotide exchange factor GrpE [Actinomycetota bacterium]
MSDETPFGPLFEKPEVRVVDKRKLTADQPGESGSPAPEVPEEDAVRALEEARAQAASYLEDLKRLKAEFENYRKRMVREQTVMIERASASIVERLLPILDNFELALMAADRTKDYESMVRGVEMVYGELLEVLKREGLERIDSLHKRFDPELHEAVMHAEGEGDEIVVLDEMRPGYKLGGRVIRPAMVKVGSKQ